MDNNYELKLTPCIEQLIARICCVYHLSAAQALHQLKATVFYTALMDADAGLWHEDADKLFDIYQEEIELGRTLGLPIS